MLNYEDYREINNEYYSRLKEGNFVIAFLNIGCSEHTVIKAEAIEDWSVDCSIEYPDLGIIKGKSINFQQIYPIPLNSFWRGIIGKKIDIPSKIKYVHEFQNWYSVMHKKQEFEFDEVEMSNGDNVETYQLERMLMPEIYYGEQLRF